jgi:hypothetical protein
MGASYTERIYSATKVSARKNEAKRKNPQNQ